MIAINKLYGILLGSASVPEAYQWYVKKFTPYATNDKIQGILKILLVAVSVDKRVMFACLACNATLHTVFGKEIEERDPVNTYLPVSRPPDSANDSSDFCLSNMVGASENYKQLKRYLDEDIMEKLTAPSWVDYIAAGCLQILREIDKK